MRIKFVMFPSGVCFFPEYVCHDECVLINKEGRIEDGVSAGHVELDSNGHLVLGGFSISLGLDAGTAYPDWTDRHVRSGLAPERKTYGDIRGIVFFLPFMEIIRYGVGGIGGSSPSIPIAFEEVVHYMEKR